MPRTRIGITLIELVVVVSIIAVLASLLMVAVQQAREGGRDLSCINNLRQFAISSQTHVATHGHFPASGWGSNWVPVRDRGSGVKQPGGWMYNLLPFLEATTMHELGASEDEVRAGLEIGRVEEFNSLIHPSFVCPTKLPPNNDRMYSGTAWSGRAHGGYPSSYAINAGSSSIFGELVGPASLDFSDFSSLWPANVKPANGLACPGQLLRPKDVTDGMSLTIFAGEKYVVRNRRNYIGDTLSPWFGFSLSSVRYVVLPPFRDGDPHGDPQSFGSAHQSHFNVAMCDGSIRRVSFDVSQNVLVGLGVRNDGIAISAEDF